MNDLFSSSFARFRSEDQSPSHSTVQMSGFPPAATSGVNLDKFFEDVEGVKDDLRDLETLYASLQAAHEQSKTLLSAKGVRDLRSKMDGDVTSALKKAKVIKVRLEALDRNNAANRSLPGCGPGSSSDRTRTSVVNGLRKKLQVSKDGLVDPNFIESNWLG